MNFNSLEFLVFFPVVLALYWLLPHRFRRWLLLVASYLFYLWWNPWTGFLLLGTTLVSWLAAQAIERSQSPRGRKLWLALALVCCLGCLGVFKYAGFLTDTAGSVARLLGGEGFDVTVDLVLPVGISFYTFQTLSYVLDVYRGEIKTEPDLGYYALFVSFFPQLVAGPIERPDHLLPQLKARHTFQASDLYWGLCLLCRGYFKKLVVADGLSALVDSVYAVPGEASGPAIALATVAFAVQIYCDFSGYSDIAQGAARMLGIRLMDNFRRPYGAKSVREFWRRWHISLTSWFTDYLYKPLGGSRKGLARQCVNILIVFLVSGLWHGADWTFVVWGGFLGLCQVAGLLWQRAGGPALPDNRLTGLLQQGRTFLLVTFAWLFFRAGSLEEAGLLLRGLTSGWDSVGWQRALSLMELTADTALRAALSVLCLLLLERADWSRGTDDTEGAVTAAQGIFFLVSTVAVAWLALLAANGENAFIYFQF